MAVCRCDPTAALKGGVQPDPVAFRAFLKVNGQPVPGPLVLRCKRCKATWKAL